MRQSFISLIFTKLNKIKKGLFFLKIKNRYSYHLERKIIDNTIYIHDNTPHIKWKNVEAFPKYFHNKSEMNIEASYISDNVEVAVIEMLNFIKEIIKIN